MADEAKNPKAKTVLDDMPSRRIVSTIEAATALIISDLSTYSDFGNYDLVSPIDLKRGVQGVSVDDEGSIVFDSEIFSDDMDIMIAVLTQRGEGTGSSTVKGIVVSPVPTRESILADAVGSAWLDKMLGTELNRIAVRILRDKDADIKDETLLDQLPKTLADYVTSNRGGSSTLLEAFEENWKVIKTALGKLSKAWKLRNLSKKEFKNGMSSSAYASQWYPELETTKKGSLFVFALQAFANTAKEAGKDATIFARWLETRNEHLIDSDDADDEDDLSLDALTAAMVAGAAGEATEETATDEAEAEATDTEA